MVRPGSLPSRLAALALAALVAGAAALALGRPALTSYADAGRRIETLRGELARLAAAADRAEARRRALGRLDRDTGLRGLLLPPASEATATARLQERFATIIETAGARLGAAQALPVTALGSTRRIGLRLQFTADTRSLRAILHALEYQRPVAVVESVYVYSQSSRAVGAPLPLNVRLDVFSFLAAGG